MKVIVGMATHAARRNTVHAAIDSLRQQVDEIYLYDNEINPDSTDNGKFYGLTQINEPCYYFSCDDDLIYPRNYVARMIEEIERCKTIVTCHGRLLKWFDVDYYAGHKGYSFESQTTLRELDVAGTGVTAFRTDYFNPVGIHESEYKCMSDLVFSLEAAKQDKLITLMPHPEQWIRQIPVQTSIKQSKTKDPKLIELANEIWQIKQSR